MARIELYRPPIYRLDGDTYINTGKTLEFGAIVTETAEEDAILFGTTSPVVIVNSDGSVTTQGESIRDLVKNVPIPTAVCAYNLANTWVSYIREKMLYAIVDRTELFNSLLNLESEEQYVVSRSFTFKFIADGASNFKYYWESSKNYDVEVPTILPNSSLAGPFGTVGGVTNISYSGYVNLQMYSIPWKSSTNLWYIIHFTYNNNSIRYFREGLQSTYPALYQYLQTNPTPVQPSDPFSPGGTSEPGGGGGTFDDGDDEVGLDSKPTLSSADTGFVRIYNPTLSQVRSLAHYLFTNESWLQTAINHLKQYFESPIDAFILFNIVPCRVPDGGTDNFRVLFLDTGVQLTVAANQFVDVNCGDLVIDEYYGSALDYSPYTTISLYLPYIGNVDIDTDEVMGHTIRVAYRIDVVSGGCVAYVSRVDGSDDDQQERVLYQFSGHCAINIPFSQLDASSYISAMIQAATAVAVGVATGGAGAAAELGTEASVMTAGETAIASAGESTSLPPVMSMTPQIPVDLGLPRGSSSTPNIFEGLSPATMANTVGSVMGMKMHVQHAGGFSGNTGYLAKRRPYAIIKRPRMCNPDEYGSFNGYPSMMYERLGNLSGFTQVQQIQLTEIPCTAGEQAELMSLLKSGVIL